MTNMAIKADTNNVHLKISIYFQQLSNEITGIDELLLLNLLNFNKKHKFLRFKFTRQMLYQPIKLANNWG